MPDQAPRRFAVSPLDMARDVLARAIYHPESGPPDVDVQEVEQAIREIARDEIRLAIPLYVYPSALKPDER